MILVRAAAVGLTAAATVFVVTQTRPPSEIDPSVAAVLTRHLRFSAQDLADLQRGKVVKHGIDTNAPGEIAVAGAILVNVPKREFVDAFRDIVRFKRGPGVLEIGRVSTPAKLEDLADLTVTSDDFDASSCRPRDCNIRLPADEIRRAREGDDGNGSDAQRRAESFFKQMLVADLNAYLDGAGRFAQYDDGPRPIRPIDEFNGILANDRSVGALVPGLPEHLARFPAAPLSGADDFLYWSKEKAGRAPFITVTHVTIVSPQPKTCVITTKDVYSSRYIDASLGLTIATDAGEEAFYLVYANRSRANALKGFLSGVRRSLVERRARASLEENLSATKARLEHAHRS